MSLKPRARRLRSEPTPAERKLWFEYLRTCPAKFTRQKPLGRYIADFYCAEFRLVVELDGDSHFNERGASYDARRGEALALLGIRVLRFTNAEVLEAFEGVCGEIDKVLQQRVRR